MARRKNIRTRPEVVLELAKVFEAVRITVNSIADGTITLPVLRKDEHQIRFAPHYSVGRKPGVPYSLAAVARYLDATTSNNKSVRRQANPWIRVAFAVGEAAEQSYLGGLLKELEHCEISFKQFCTSLAVQKKSWLKQQRKHKRTAAIAA